MKGKSIKETRPTILIAILCALVAPIGANGDESLPMLLVTRGDSVDISDYAEQSERIYSELLAERGISTIVYDGELTSDSSVEEFLENARMQGTVFLAINTIAADESTISIDTIFLYTTDGTVLFESSSKGSLSLGLERKLDFFARQIAGFVTEEIEKRGIEEILDDKLELEESEVDLASSSTSPIKTEEVDDSAPDHMTADSELPAPAGTQGTEQDAQEESERAEIEEPTDNGHSEPDAIDQNTPDATEGKIGANAVSEDTPYPSTKSKVLSLHTSVAMAVPLGTASDYLSIGVKSSIQASLLVLERLFSLYVTLDSNVGYFRAAGILRSTDNLSASFGPGLVVCYLWNLTWEPYLGMHGGVGLLGVYGPEEIWLWKAVPWAALAAGLRYSLNESIDISLGCKLDVLLESSLHITSIDPGIGWRISW